MKRKMKNAKITIGGEEVSSMPSNLYFKSTIEENEDIKIILPHSVLKQLKDEEFKSLKLTTKDGFELSIRKKEK